MAGVKRHVAQDAEQNQRPRQEPAEQRTGHQTGPLPAREGPRGLSQSQPQPHRQKPDNERIQPPGGGEVTMGKLMHSPQSAAARALPSSQFMKRTDREEARRGGI